MYKRKLTKTGQLWEYTTIIDLFNSIGLLVYKNKHYCSYKQNDLIFIRVLLDLCLVKISRPTHPAL